MKNEIIDRIENLKQTYVLDSDNLTVYLLWPVMQQENPWWQRKEFGDVEYYTLSTDIVNWLLDNYIKAEWRDNNTSKITFENLNDYTAFVLRWCSK